MSVVCTTPYRPPAIKDPIEVTRSPMYGIGRIAPEDYADTRNLQPIFTYTHENFQSNPIVTFPPTNVGHYLYYMAPLTYGPATFRDPYGFVGGWDGASWPLDDMDVTVGPVVVSYLGIEWNLYRTDWDNSWGGDYTILFNG
jgi:hypothetical protein